jgi:raffinose/stachyose/melibiose transport system substrate-binding protein
MIRKMRKMVAIASASAAIITLAACSGSNGATESSASSNDSVTLTVMHKWPEPIYEDFWNDIKEGFESEHPGVTVEMTAVQDDPYKEQIKVLTASNELPDVYFAWPGKYGEQFFESGLAADLTDAMESDGWADSLTSAAVDAYTDDGKIYGVPISMSGKFMVYNTKLFEQVGVEVPETLDDLVTSCAAFKEAGIQPIAFGNQAGWPGVHYLTSLIAKYVPSDVTEKDFTPETASFDDPGYIEALNMLTKISDACFPEDSNGISNDSAKAAVQTGQAAMGYFETNNFSIFTAEGGGGDEIVNNWSFFALPDAEGASGDNSSLTGAPDGFLVNENSENKELAIEFLKYLTTKQSGKLALEVFGRPSTVIGADEDVDITPQLAEAIEVLDSTKTFNVWLDTATESSVAQAFMSGAQAAVDGSESAEQIMEEVKAASDSAK